LADSGAKWMGMGDAGISFRAPANGTVPDGYVEGWIDKLAPAMGNLSALGLLDKAYVYGFDEVRSTPPIRIHSSGSAQPYMYVRSHLVYIYRLYYAL
jgi:hypothetical protein